MALQLGGCDPKELAQAAKLGAAAGYAEINLNVGCPSDRVKNGSFGACLLLKPALVAQCVARIRDATALPVTVKCRIGIDDRDDYEFFEEFVDTVAVAGWTRSSCTRARRFWPACRPSRIAKFRRSNTTMCTG